LDIDDTIRAEIPHRDPEHHSVVETRTRTVQGLVGPDYLLIGLKADRWDDRELHDVLVSLGWAEFDGHNHFGWGTRFIVSAALVDQVERHFIAAGKASRLFVWKLPRADPRWERRA